VYAFAGRYCLPARRHQSAAAHAGVAAIIAGSPYIERIVVMMAAGRQPRRPQIQNQADGRQRAP
jgi:hypothetical protein